MYKQLLAGDYRKLRAQSNDSPSGGGARDLRLPFAAFDDVMSRLLSNERTEARRRDGKRVAMKVRTGPVYIDVEDAATGIVEVHTAEMVWETPTDARGSEGRIAKVHASPAMAQLLQVRDESMGEVFVLFVQDDHGELRVHYAYEKDLRDGEWADAVAQPILKHLDGDRRQDRAVIGSIDFLHNHWYAHGLR